MNTELLNYENVEVKTQQGGKKIVRKVSIKNGKGYKSVTKYHRGKKIGTVKKSICMDHMQSIKKGEFIPQLFKDCKCIMKNKTHKNRK